MGQLLKWTRQSNLLGGVSLRRADGWNLKNHSQLTVTRPDPPSMLIVTIREGEREKQLKYTDVEEMRVVTNDRDKAEQIKSGSTLSAQGNLLRNKVENVVMDGSKIGKVGKMKDNNI